MKNASRELHVDYAVDQQVVLEELAMEERGDAMLHESVRAFASKAVLGPSAKSGT